MHNIRMTPTPDPKERSSTRCGPRVCSGLTSVLTKVQAKRWSHSVPGRIVRELRGAPRVDERGLIVTTAEFTPEAIREAAAEGKATIGLPGGDALVRSCAERGIGADRRQVVVLEPIPRDLRPQ